MSHDKDKFDPMKEINTLRDSLSRAVEQGMKNIGGAYPAVDVYETDDVVIVRTVPIVGLDAASIEVSMENGILTLRGTAAADSDLPDGAKLLIQERRSGEFKRDIKIPRTVKAEAAQAKLKQGALTITLPKIKDSEPQIIGVTPAE